VEPNEETGLPPDVNEPEDSEDAPTKEKLPLQKEDNISSLQAVSDGVLLDGAFTVVNGAGLLVDGGSIVAEGTGTLADVGEFVGEATSAAGELISGTADAASSVFEGVGGALDGCSGCSLAILITLFTMMAGTAMAVFR
jgi:hypothetical protein